MPNGIENVPFSYSTCGQRIMTYGEYNPGGGAEQVTRARSYERRALHPYLNVSSTYTNFKVRLIRIGKYVRNAIWCNQASTFGLKMTPIESIYLITLQEICNFFLALLDGGCML